MPVITVAVQCPMCGALGHSNISIDQTTGFAKCIRAGHQFVSLHHAPGLSPEARQEEKWLIPVQGEIRNVDLLAKLKELYPVGIGPAGEPTVPVLLTSRPEGWGCEGPIVAGADGSFDCGRCGYKNLKPSQIAEEAALPFDHMSVLQAHRDTPIVTA